ncbi:MAG: hypothetical protein F4Y61_02895 [Rhodothermaceae bacterium]|nr:hypothetical protein [Rhodothermaceae bacterium]MYF79850.1 hypothetical protein [Chloroflexota bacterium]
MEDELLAQDIFSVGNRETVTVRIGNGDQPTGGFSPEDHNAGPTFETYTVNAIVTPMSDPAPTEHNAATGGRLVRLRDKGGIRPKETATVLISREDVTITRRRLNDARMFIQIVYDGYLWVVNWIEFWPSYYAVNVSTEFDRC